MHASPAFGLTSVSKYQFKLRSWRAAQLTRAEVRRMHTKDMRKQFCERTRLNVNPKTVSCCFWLCCRITHRCALKLLGTDPMHVRDLKLNRGSPEIMVLAKFQEVMFKVQLVVELNQFHLIKPIHFLLKKISKLLFVIFNSLFNRKSLISLI